MKNPRIVLWPLAFFPWIDYLVRTVCDFHGFHFLPGPVWDELFLVFCMVLVLFGSRTGPGMPDLSGPVRWCFLTFVLACALSLSVNGVPFRMGVEALRVTFQPMLYALITMVLLRDEGLRDEFIKLIILSGVLIALVGLGQYALGIESRRWVNKPNMEQFRIVSIFANPNALAGYLNMVLAFSLARAWYGHGGRGMIFSAASLVLAACLVVTFSRGAWLACFIMILFYGITTRRGRIPVIVSSAVIVLLAVSADVATRVAELFGSAYYEQSAIYGRLAFWSKALATIQAHPLFGVGMGMAGGSLSIKHHLPGAGWIDNHYLKIGAEVGICGLISFVVLLFTLFVLSLRGGRGTGNHKERAVYLGISGVILTSAIQNLTASIWEALYVGVHFYAFVGMLFALRDPAVEHDGSAA